MLRRMTADSHTTPCPNKTDIVDPIQSQSRCTICIDNVYSFSFALLCVRLTINIRQVVRVSKWPSQSK